MKLFMLTNIPTPNQLDFFDALHQEHIDLTVAYCHTKENREWYLPEHGGYQSLYLPGHKYGTDLHVNPSVLRVLASTRFDHYILGGSYNIPTFQLAATYLNIVRKPWHYWGEALRYAPLPYHLRVLRKFNQKQLSRAASVLSAGTMAIPTFERAGVPRSRIKVFPYVEDVSRFVIDRSCGDSRPLRFLFVGQLIHRKGVDVLLQAAQALIQRGYHFELHIVGAGVLEPELRKRCDQPALKKCVSFRGFVQPDQLPHMYESCDVFVFPSRYDGWALVVNEAMAAGMPVVSTDKVGAALDLIQNGQNGFIVPAEDAVCLADKMSLFLEKRELARELGDAAHRTMMGWTPQIAARRMIAHLSGDRIPDNFLDIDGRSDATVGNR